MALQSIQASLAAVHERLNRVESQRRSPLSLGNVVFGSSSPLGMGYRALANALHDIALLIGIASDGRGDRNGGAAPQSYHLTSSNRKGGRAESVAGQSVGGRKRGNGDSSGRPGWSALLRLLIALVNLSLRLALDLTSVTVVVSLFLLVVKRVTGRGDPLVLLRLVRRYSNIRIAKQSIEVPKSIKLG